jgi:hypothetical protein
MKIVLQSQDNFNEIAFLDVVTGIVSISQKSEKAIKTNGYYSIRDGSTICFFRVDENLYFALDRQIIEFQEGDKVFIESLPSNQCLFSIQRNQETIFKWKYKSYQLEPTISIFQVVNPMTSEEDFDIFALVHNVINNANRKERAFRRT